MFSENQLRTIGEASAPEAWRYIGSGRSLLDDTIDFTFRICSAGSWYALVRIPGALARREEVIAAVVTLRRELDKKACAMNADVASAVAAMRALKWVQTELEQ